MSLHSLLPVLRRPRWRRWIAVALLPLLLTMQLANAAYLCPRLSQALSPTALMPAPCADPIAASDQPSLCKAHCESDSQLSGPADLSPAMPASDWHPTWLLPVRAVSAIHAGFLTAPPRGGPPLYLLHMVWRD